MPSLQSMSLAEVLDAFSSSAPTPGGGSAAAVGGAIGAALLVMVAGLPKTRTDAAAELDALKTAAAALIACRDRLLSLADADAAAYDAVTAAYRLPKGSDQEKASRTGAIRVAMRTATDVPLDTMRGCADALERAVVVARVGNRNASSDAAAGVHLLGAALLAAEGNVRINLASLPDDEYRTRMAADADRIRQTGTTHARDALKNLQ